MRNFREELKKIRLIKKREFEQAHIEYDRFLTEHYNSDPLNAFTAFVQLRNELERRVPEREQEIKDSILLIVERVKESTSDDNLLKIIEAKLSSQIARPNLSLYSDLDVLIKSYAKENDVIINRFPYDSNPLIDELVTNARSFFASRVLKGVLDGLINDIVDNALPVEISLDKNLITLDAFVVEVPVEIPDKKIIYSWYGDIRRDASNNVEAFESFKKLMSKRGISLKDCKITTNDPENFYRAYTKSFKKGTEVPKKKEF